MLKSLLLMSAVAIAAPALAQTTAPANSTDAAQPAASATPAPAQPAATATPSTTAQQPTAAATPEAGITAAPAAAATPAAPTNSSDAVAAVVAADWAKYDTDKDGYLSKTEFGAWMTALREQNPAQKAAVQDAEAWTNSAFAMADKDKSGSVNKDELASFLKG